MNATPKSPLILGASWGHLHVAGLGESRDVKLWPGGGRPWDWSETGTHHVPGIQPADVEELIERGSSTIVLSQGIRPRASPMSTNRSAWAATGRSSTAKPRTPTYASGAR
jgi:hypothetical protein